MAGVRGSRRRGRQLVHSYTIDCLKDRNRGRDGSRRRRSLLLWLSYGPGNSSNHSRLPEAPVLERGTITGFSVKMWGVYPALVRSSTGSSTGSVSGMVWELTSEVQFWRLRNYETSAYRWCLFTVVLESGKTLPDCSTFYWAGDPNSSELEQGGFDFERYQKHIKPSFLRRGRLDGSSPIEGETIL
jgi:hypothetical protein